MSELWIVVVGAVSVLSAVAVITWLARPSEFRSISATTSAPPRRFMAGSRSVAAPGPVYQPPAVPNPLRAPLDSGPASPRTIIRGTGEQASVWAKPPSFADEAQDASTG